MPEISSKNTHLRATPTSIPPQRILFENESKSQNISDAKKGDEDRSYSCLYRAEKKCPRLYNIIFFIIIPMMLLICWCMLCGYFIARLEREAEMSENKISIREYEEELHNMDIAISTVQRSYDDCIEIFMKDSMDPSDLINGTELKMFMQNCTSVGVEESRGIMKKEVGDKEMDDLTANHLSFNWNTCSEDGDNIRSTDQGKFLYNKWNDSRREKYEEILKRGEAANEDAYMLAIQNATIPEDLCKLNPAGGAIFWFTVMT